MTEKTIRAVVDRIEGEYAVLLVGESRGQVPWRLSELPDGAAEGSVLSIEMSLDETATADSREEIESLIRRMERGE